MKKMNKKGFTIVELTIVIAVIAILAAVLIPTFSGVITKAKESNAQQVAASIYKEAYAIDLADGTLDGHEGSATTTTTEGSTTTTDATNNVIGSTVKVEGHTFTWETEKGALKKFVIDIDGYRCAFNGSEWTITEVPATGTDATIATGHTHTQQPQNNDSGADEGQSENQGGDTGENDG